MADQGAIHWQLALEGIYGLDLESGLRTVGGRAESLARLLRRYDELHAEDAAKLREAARGEPSTAQTLAHSLKGAAGFLGLVRIQAVAAELEAAFRDAAPGSRLAALLDDFESENQATCLSIRGLLAG